MIDSTTPRTRMTHGSRRRGRASGGLGPPRSDVFGVIGLADTFWYRLHPASPARLGPVRPGAHAAAKSTI
jgi:hypothetical protein